MKILGIETSCDETAVCILECEGGLAATEGATDGKNFKMKILGNALHSQIESHRVHGGVVPIIAKREHALNLIPLFISALKDAGLYKKMEGENNPQKLTVTQIEKINEIFGRGDEFKKDFIEMIESIEKPEGIEAIAVTEGPGLEPALWMGIIFAQALSEIFQIPLIPINHMEGHIMSVLPNLEANVDGLRFPVISLLISGGHTELVLMRDWHTYEIIGETRDDAVGEAFDKVARMLDLPYPGGPEISRLAKIEREKDFDKNSLTKTSTVPYILPRPMINSKDYDFSFSGLKTAVLYSLKENKESAGVEKIEKEKVAKEFEEAITEVLISKTLRAIEEYNAKTLIVAGGVVSNEYLRQEFKKELEKFDDVALLIPEKDLRTDNAVMIAIAGYLKKITNIQIKNKPLRAKGTLRLE